jgi:hypothetical protein
LALSTPDEIQVPFGLPVAVLVSSASCARYGPFHGNTAADPAKSVRGPADGRYKIAFIEFGDQGSALDTSQRAAAINVIRQAQRPLLFVYIHGWLNDADFRDVCRFEHFLDLVSSFPEVKARKVNVIGAYIAWRGKDLTIPGLNLFTFWSRKGAGAEIAAQNSCLATINELAIAARDPAKQVHHCILMGHSFGGLVLGNTISHSILDASSTGARNSSPWDMAVAFNSADSSISTRQLMSELDYLYKYDASRHAYVGRAPGADEGSAIDETGPCLSSSSRRTIRQRVDFSLSEPVSPTRSPSVTIGTGCLFQADMGRRYRSRNLIRTLPAMTNISSIIRWNR